MVTRTVIALIVLVAAIAAVAVVSGARSWRAETGEMRARLEAARVPIEPPTYDPAETDALPIPVRRYFSAALSDGQALIAAVSVEHAGVFNMSESEERWKQFTSTQRTIVRRPGFDWDARIGLFPGVKVHVHDAYIDGEGILYAKVAGIVPVMDMPRDRELARAELMRWFAETAWYPTALLPSRGVRWEAVDDSTADATMTDGDITLTMRFSFGSDGLIESVRADSRGHATGDGGIDHLPWEARWSGWVVREGMRVPTGGEVGWQFPDGWRPYWRGRIVNIEYEFAR